jgi:hypothetical protein
MLTTEHMDILAVTGYTQAGSGVAGALNGAKIIFGTNDLVPSKTTVVADITQSIDAGLAPASVTWGAAGRDEVGDITTLTASIPVKLTTSTNACVVKCWALTDSAGTNVLMSEVFAEPLNLPDNVQLYNVQVPFAPGNPQGKQIQVSS